MIRRRQQKFRVTANEVFWLAVDCIFPKLGISAFELPSVFPFMKTSSIVIIWLASTLVGLNAQVTNTKTGTSQTTNTKAKFPAKSDYRVVDRSANQLVWQWETYQIGPIGQVVTNIHKYTELATGLHYKNAKGQWQESKEEIKILPNGTAAATNGQHQAYFPGNIYKGVIELVTPDGRHLKSRPLGLSYDDGTNSILIAELTNSIGYVVNSNQVIYPNAFTGFKADLRYTYTKAGFEQDVILRQQPPTPESLGLYADTAKLQVLTEFFSPPKPAIQSKKLPKQAGLVLEDHSLNFGTMQMIPGRAFLLGKTAQDAGVRVSKEWLQINGRQLLVEQVPVDAIVQELAALPLTAMRSSGLNKSRTASKHWTLPPQRLAQITTESVLLASTTIPAPGFVLDYQTVGSSETDYTFQGDTTYYIDDYTYLNGTTVFEGGTVIKYTSANNAPLIVNDSVVCKTGPYRPAVFTSMDDDSVGETISGSSGTPTTLSYNTYLYVQSDDIGDLKYLRFAYAGAGLYANNKSIWHSQFVHCNRAVYIWENISLYNVLFSQCDYALDPIYAGTIIGENLTIDGGFCDGSVDTLCITNCILAEEPTAETINSSHIFTQYQQYPNYFEAINPWPAFQTIGGGGYYLADNSNCRNAGTTNINPALLADLTRKTTYPPIVYSDTTISLATTFSPQAQRDTDIPDVGYHYDPLDYAFGGVNVSSNLIFSAGTAVGWFELPGSGGPGYGISLPNGSTTTFNGTAVSPCNFARYESVQEGGNGLWVEKGWLAGIIAGGSYDNTAFPLINAQFTHFYHPANDPGHFRDYNNGIMVQARHSEFYGAFGGYDIDVIFTNCLIYRVDFWQGTADPAYAWETYRNMFVNCTWYGGSMEWDHWEGSPYWKVLIQNCAFDGILLNLYDAGGNLSWLTADYNATNTSMTYGGYALPGTHNVAISSGYNWQTSWLGDFYLPYNSTLLDAGSTTADQVGLYHFTTQLYQTKETNSVVDIGYHYVAVDYYTGIPQDADGDGIPDYLEDANGNGVVNTGETDWQNALDLGLRVNITRPRSGSSLP